MLYKQSQEENKNQQNNCVVASHLGPTSHRCWTCEIIQPIQINMAKKNMQRVRTNTIFFLQKIDSSTGSTIDKARLSLTLTVTGVIIRIRAELDELFQRTSKVTTGVFQMKTLFHSARPFYARTSFARICLGIHSN